MKTKKNTISPKARPHQNTSPVSQITELSATAQLLDCLANVGVRVGGIPFDQGLKRLRNEGDKSGTKNIALVAHSSPCFTVWYENFKTGEKGSFTVKDKNAKPPTQAERIALAKKIEAGRRRKKERQEKGWAEGAIKASKIWQSLPPAHLNLPYLKSKVITEISALRQGYDDAVAVPMISDGKIVGIQFITNSSKLIMKGSRLGGAYFMWGVIGGNPKVIYLAESLSTSFAIYKMTGKPCICCFSARNLLAVGEKVRARYNHHTRLIFCADNDIRESSASNQENVGIVEATKASRIVAGEVAIPELDGKKCDFWDIYHATLSNKGGIK
jgi:putative DNA primase/helicase